MKDKKKFKDTKVGKFLLGNGSKLIDGLADALPNTGFLSIVKNLIQKDKDITPQDKETALKLLEMDLLEMQETTKRWESDNLADSFWTKNIRPMTLAFLTITLFIYIILDSSVDGFTIDSSWIDLLSSLLLLVYGGYFGARSAEKIVKIWKK
jgi:hypothetical protein